MTEDNLLPNEGNYKIVRKELIRCDCDYCGEPASYKNTYLNERHGPARRNPASSAYGKDDIGWCSDFDDLVCSECHVSNETDNVPDGYNWCATFHIQNHPHMFLRWFEELIEEGSAKEMLP